MINRKAQTIAWLLFGALLAGGCGSLPTIAVDETYCCHPMAESITTYRVEFEDTPEFLKPMLRDESSIVLAELGYEYTEGDAESILLMTFVNKTMEQSPQEQEAWERIAPGGGVRFIAQVVVEFKDSVSGELVLSGNMQRIHNVYEGSYMHDAPARAAMREAFVELFANLPNRSIR